MKKAFFIILIVIVLIAIVIASNSPIPQFTKTQLQTINVQEGLD